MRISSFLFFFLCPSALVASPQKDIKNQAQLDRLTGSVHSVSTQVVMTPIGFIQPEGLILVGPISCRDCEYDLEGNRIRSGQKQLDGTFIGENVEIVRDGQGHVVQRNRTNAADGQVFMQEKDGPFGSVEEIYSHGPIARSTKSYDRLGYLAEWLCFNATGQQVSRSVTRTDPDGQWTERSRYGKDSQLQYRETYDPETDFQRFESYDESGAVRVSFTLSHDKVQTFWEASDDPHQFGNRLGASLGKGRFNDFYCHKDGTCDVTHGYFTYAANSDYQIPTTAELRNDLGTLQYAAWFEYEFDDHRNWTKRTVWILSPEIPQRTLYETDIRQISYWTK